MIDLRKVTKDDAKVLFVWINEPEARINAVNPKSIFWPEHVAWLDRKLVNNSSYMYILADSKENVGVIRFDKNSEGFLISYSIDKNYRGKGFGTMILKMGMDQMGKIVENPVFIGYVKKGNIASEKIFDRLDFSVERKEIIQNIEFIVYKK